MTQPTGEPTATFAPATATATLPAAAGSGFDEELRRLLRSRLILIHLLALAVVLLLGVLSFVGPAGRGDVSLRPDQGNPWGLAPLLLECVVGAAILWRTPAMSLRSLRLWELVFFATHDARPATTGSRYWRPWRAALPTRRPSWSSSSAWSP
jgi:hypothetical protein